MTPKNFVGLKVITKFEYRGAFIYIRSRDRFFEQLIVHKNNLYTHYFEAPPETRKRHLYQEEEMNIVNTIIQTSKVTVDEIIHQRSLVTKFINYFNGTTAGHLYAEWRTEKQEPEQAQTPGPAIQIPKEARGNKSKKQ